MRSLSRDDGSHCYFQIFFLLRCYLLLGIAVQSVDSFVLKDDVRSFGETSDSKDMLSLLQIGVSVDSPSSEKAPCGELFGCDTAQKSDMESVPHPTERDQAKSSALVVQFETRHSESEQHSDTLRSVGSTDLRAYRAKAALASRTAAVNSHRNASDTMSNFAAIAAANASPVEVPDAASVATDTGVTSVEAQTSATQTVSSTQGGAMDLVVGVALVGSCVLIAVYIFAEVLGVADYHSDLEGQKKVYANQSSTPSNRSRGQPSAAHVPPSTMKGRFFQSTDSPRNSIDPSTTIPLLDGSPRSPQTLERMSFGPAMTPAPGGSFRAPNEGGQTPTRLSSNQSVAVRPGGKPPPVCRELVLPHTEAWFAVSFANLEFMKCGDFDLYGLSGKPLLRASIETDGIGNGKVSISMKPPKSPILGSVTCSAGPNNKPHMLVRGKNDQPYGELHALGGVNFVLTHQSQQVVRVAFDQSDGQLTLTSSIDGSGLACASKCVSTEFNAVFRNEDHLEVRVDPGVDAVLALLCVIGAVIFGASAGADLPSSARPSHLPGVAVSTM